MSSKIRYQTLAIKCAFIGTDGKSYVYEYQGGTYTDKTNWLRVDGEEIHSQRKAVEGAKNQAILDIRDEFGSQRVTPEMLSESTKQLINASGGGTITNLPDDEDLTVVGDVLKERDRVAGKDQFVSRGRKILRRNIVQGKNMLTTAMMPESNTIYVIRYDFDLGGKQVDLPENCTLFFEGGTFSNGILNAKGAYINTISRYQIFDNISVTESSIFTNDWEPEWFGASVDKTDNAYMLNKAIELIHQANGGGLLYLNGMYSVQSSILLRPKVSIAGRRRNSMLYRLSGDQLSCGFNYTGNDKNVWVLDTYTGLTQTPYNEPDVYVAEVVTTNRKDGLRYTNFDINCNGAFGGFRLFNAYSADICSISIENAGVGLSLSTGWYNHFSNVRIKASAIGLYLGNLCTINTFTDVCLGIYKKGTIKLSDVVLKSKADSLPQYAADIESCAIVSESVNEQSNGLNSADFTVENFDAVLCANNTNGTISGMYIEGEYKTLIWNKKGNLKVNKPQPTNRKCLSPYEFGTDDGVLYVEGFSYCRCYDSGKQNRINYFIFGLRDFTYYYDSWEGDETVAGLALANKKKARNKIIVMNQDIFINNEKPTSANGGALNSQLNCGVSQWNGIQFSELYEREYPDFTRFMFRSKFTPSGERVLENKKYVFGIVGSDMTIIPMSGTLKMKNCELSFEKEIQNADVVFECAGKNKIKVAKIYTGKQIFRLSGSEDIDVELTSDADVPDWMGVIANPEHATPYRITIRSKGKVRVITNTSRPTTKNIGFVYFDKSLKKPIWWDGSRWVDAAGAQV